MCCSLSSRTGARGMGCTVLGFIARSSGTTDSDRVVAYVPFHVGSLCAWGGGAAGVDIVVSAKVKISLLLVPSMVCLLLPQVCAAAGTTGGWGLGVVAASFCVTPSGEIAYPESLVIERLGDPPYHCRRPHQSFKRHPAAAGGGAGGHLRRPSSRRRPTPQNREDLNTASQGPGSPPLLLIEPRTPSRVPRRCAFD